MIGSLSALQAIAAARELAREHDRPLHEPITAHRMTRGRDHRACWWVQGAPGEQDSRYFFLLDRRNGELIQEGSPPLIPGGGPVSEEVAIHIARQRLDFNGWPMRGEMGARKMRRWMIGRRFWWVQTNYPWNNHACIFYIDEATGRIISEHPGYNLPR